MISEDNFPGCFSFCVPTFLPSFQFSIKGSGNRLVSLFSLPFDRRDFYSFYSSDLSCGDCRNMNFTSSPCHHPTLVVACSSCKYFWSNAENTSFLLWPFLFTVSSLRRRRFPHILLLIIFVFPFFFLASFLSSFSLFFLCFFLTSLMIRVLPLLVV